MQSFICYHIILTYFFFYIILRSVVKLGYRKKIALIQQRVYPNKGMASGNKTDWPPKKGGPSRSTLPEHSDILIGRDFNGDSVMKSAREIFKARVENHEIDRLINPFSEFWGKDKGDYMETLNNAKAVWKGADKRTKLTMVDDKYGRPVDGTLTAYRGKKAENFITNNIIECCETIKNFGKQNEDGTFYCTFGELFKIYERINDKLVGLLVRARRHKLLDFPGEMLYQRQDDRVIITLFKVPTFDELNLKFINFKAEKESGEEPTVQ